MFSCYQLFIFNRMHLIFASPSDAEFKQVCQYIQAFELDDRQLKKEEFCIASANGQLLGFGRLRQHSDCTELCSLGVIESHRHKGIGTAVTQALIGKAKGTVYLVCIIPGFFTPLGFQEVTDFPSSIRQKLDYCTQSLPVPEPYVAMKRSKG